MSAKYTFLLALGIALAGCHDGDAKAHDHAESRGAPAQNEVVSSGTAGGSDHEHHHAGGATTLTLDDGKKWQTDATLRVSMTAIRDQLQAAVKPIHAKTYSDEDYAGLAAGIETQLGKIVAGCKLPKDADDQLHLVLAQISEGAKLMKQGEDRMAGAVKVIQGLEAYSEYFDHPGWRPLEH